MITLQPFTIELLPFLLLFIVLIVCSAMISASETAFFSLTPNQLKQFREDTSKSSKTVLQLLDNQERLLSTILITNNMVNIAAIVVANSILGKLLLFHNSPWLQTAIQVVAVTFILILFGEITPKIFAAYNNLSVAKKMAMPIKLIGVIFAPVGKILTKTGSSITRSLSSKHNGNVSIDQLQDAIEITKTQTPEDKKMLTGIVRFVGTEVDQIMKPRIDVIAIDIETPYTKVKQTFLESGFSRVPVYRDSFDHVEGILFAKDLLAHLNEDDDFDWSKLMRQPYFVPEHKKINDLLEDFQSKKVHFAVVVDEYGGTLGIVSLEDILEEIVGEISDESDIVQIPYIKLDEKNYIFEGKTNLGDCERILHLPDFFENIKGNADTLAGVMLELKNDFFTEGDSVDYQNIRLLAKEIKLRRIVKIHLTILD